MIQFDYSLFIEATEEPDFFGFYSPDLEGFTGVGHSIEECAKLDPRAEQMLAEEGMESELAEWPEY